MNELPTIEAACAQIGIVLKPSPKANELFGLCPFHKDSRPSFTVNTSKNLWYCFGCQEGGNVAKLLAKAQGKTVNQVLGVGRPAKSDPITCTYDYRNEKGDLVYQVCRLEPKDFRQRRPGKNGQWIWNLDGVDPIPYKLDEIIKRPKPLVWITEGERDVLTLNGIALLATTNSGGAGKWTDSHSRWLADREVVLCGDNDEVGRKHMDQVFLSVHAYAKAVTRVELPTKFKDVTEFKESFNSPGEFAAALGARMPQPTPGLFYDYPQDAAQPMIDSVMQAVKAAQSILPVTPKGRKIVHDILWTIAQSKTCDLVYEKNAA